MLTACKTKLFYLAYDKRTVLNWLALPEKERNLLSWHSEPTVCRIQLYACREKCEMDFLTFILWIHCPALAGFVFYASVLPSILLTFYSRHFWLANNNNIRKSQLCISVSNLIKHENNKKECHVTGVVSKSKWENCGMEKHDVDVVVYQNTMCSNVYITSGHAGFCFTVKKKEKWIDNKADSLHNSMDINNDNKQQFRTRCSFACFCCRFKARTL